MSRKVLLPDIAQVELPEARRAIPHVHAYLRERILDGTLRPGIKLSQVTLSEQLGVSRTPLREVLRMLQEEGLVHIEPNQRTVVASLDPRELDEIYATRIAMEALAVTMTSPNFGADTEARAAGYLVAMREAAAQGETARWFENHSKFHRTLTAHAGEAMQKQLRQLADRSIRYIRIYQGGEPHGWHRAGDREHTAILAAFSRGNSAQARARTALHLSRTALKVLAETSPDYEPIAVPAALRMLAITE